MVNLIILVAIIAGIVFWARGRQKRKLQSTRASFPLASGSRPRLTGNMAALSEQALAEIHSTLGPGAAKEDFLHEVADFLAAMRYYRTSILAAYTDELIEAGLSDRPAVFIAKFISDYQGLPPSPERDQAIGILQWVDNYPSAGLVVGMARMTIQQLKARGY